MLAVLGHPVRHSLSPVMHNAALVTAAIDMAYVAIDVAPEDLSVALQGLGPLGFVGVNVTVPHKRRAAAACTTLSPEASLVGAVNTVVVTPRGLHGHNTDTVGFLAGLPDDVVGEPAGGPPSDLAGDPNGDLAGDRPVGRAVVLGAGGAARAVIVALVRRGWFVTVLARRPDAAIGLVDQLGAAFVDLGATDPRATTGGGLTGAGLDGAQQHLDEADLVVNATPLGLDGQSLPDPFMQLRPDQTAYDLVYNPAVTPFLDAAATTGARQVNGLAMLVGQAAAALELWTGVTPDTGVMRRAAERALVAAG